MSKIKCPDCSCDIHGEPHEPPKEWKGFRGVVVDFDCGGDFVIGLVFNQEMDDWLIEQGCHGCRAKKSFGPGESPIENQFWHAWEALGSGLVLTPQLEIGPYRVDFAYEDAKLVIECDGHEFHKEQEQRTNDAGRDRALTLAGWTVMRFTGSEIFKDANACAEDAMAFCTPAVTLPGKDGET